jgi:TolB-like protein/tetratricopeptide (TPR) repeat protein
MAGQTDNRRLTQRLATPLAAIALLAVAWLAWDRFAVAPPKAVSAPAPVGHELGGRDIYYGPPNSLAVLPFTDGSLAGDQAPQALGFAGDVLERLALIPELRVTARSSSFFFRDPSAPPRLVAERLQSAFLLRGEWREAEGQVTLTASLFDARRDRETWRKAYDGGLAELPALREALVRDAADAMPGVGSKAATATGPQPAAVPSFDPAAWLLLQRGLYQADALTRPPTHPLTGADLLSAQASLQAALDLDPTFDGARLALAELWLHPAWPPDQDGAGVDGARRLAQQLLERQPGPAAGSGGGAGRSRAEARAEARIEARALGVLSYILHRQDWDWQGAAEAGRGAVALHPGDAGLLMVAAVALSTLAEFEEARELLEASVERDPLNLGSRLRLGLLLEFSGLYDEALASYRRVLTLHPEYPAARAYRARVKALQGKGESALREAAQEADPFWRRYAQILALSVAERPGEAEPLLQAMVAEDAQIAAFQLAELYAFRGETEYAFEWLQRAREQRDPGLSALLGNPLLGNLVGDPRWTEHLEQLGLPPGLPLGQPQDAQLDWSR